MEKLFSGIEVAAVGVSVVFVCLAGLSFIMILLGKIIPLFLRKTTPAPEKPSYTPENDEEITDEIVAVISAAVASVYSMHKIHHIKFLRRSDTWQSIGRLNNMRAHQFDKKSGR